MALDFQTAKNGKDLKEAMSMPDQFAIALGKNPNLSIDRPIERQEIIDAFISPPINRQTSIRESGKNRFDGRDLAIL